MDAEAKQLIAKLTDALVAQNTTNARVAVGLERLATGLPKPSVAALIVVVGLSSLVASATVLAWEHSRPARAVAQVAP